MNGPFFFLVDGNPFLLSAIPPPTSAAALPRTSRFLCPRATSFDKLGSQETRRSESDRAGWVLNYFFVFCSTSPTFTTVEIRRLVVPADTSLHETNLSARRNEATLRHVLFRRCASYIPSMLFPWRSGRAQQSLPAVA
jgi:hypothetical protein